MLGVGCLLLALGAVFTVLIGWGCIKLIPMMFRGFVNLCRIPFQKKRGECRSKKEWKIFWTVIISLTGAGVVFCIIALCLGVTFSQFEKAYPNGIGITRKNYVSFEEDWDDDDDDEPEETENVVSEETFSNVENLKLDIGASEVQIKTGTDDKIHVDDSRMKTENVVQKRLSDDRKILEITTKMRSSFDFKNMRNVKGTLVIYLPRDYKFDQVDMEYGAVTAEIDELNAKSLKIESGHQAVQSKNADIEELDVETGAGSLDFMEQWKRSGH